MPDALEGQKQMSGPREPELETVVSHHVGLGSEPGAPEEQCC